MTIIILTMALLALLAASTVLGSPFFAILFLLPIVIIYSLIRTASVSQEGGTDDLENNNAQKNVKQNKTGRYFGRSYQVNDNSKKEGAATYRDIARGAEVGKGEKKNE